MSTHVLHTALLLAGRLARALVREEKRITKAREAANEEIAAMLSEAGPAAVDALLATLPADDPIRRTIIRIREAT